MRLPSLCRYSFFTTEWCTVRRLHGRPPLGPVHMHFPAGKQPLAVVFDQTTFIIRL